MNVYKPIVDQKYSGTAPIQTQPLIQQKTYVYNGSRSGAGTTTLYTVPEGKRAKLIYFYILSFVNDQTYLRINALNVSILNAGSTTPQKDSIYLGNESGLILNPKDTVNINAQAGSTGSLQAVIFITEEDLAVA